MIDALYIAATGMHAEQSHIDTISNNLANLNTTAYKKSRVSFDDLLYKSVDTSGLPNQKLASQKVGLGSAISAITRDFGAGDIKATDNPLDLAIRGNGFLEVVLENGEYAYTRNGSLRINEEGFLITPEGYPLSSRIQIPPDASQIAIDESGVVKVRYGNEEMLSEIGQIELAGFVSTNGLAPIGNNLYLPTTESGMAFYSDPNTNGLGSVQQGFLEASNVDLVEEMIELVVAQRSYEVNSQVIRTTDEILRIVNSLRK